MVLSSVSKGRNGPWSPLFITWLTKNPNSRLCFTPVRPRNHRHCSQPQPNEGYFYIHFNWKTRQCIGKETLSLIQLPLCTGCLKLSLFSFWMPAGSQVQTNLIYPLSWQTAVDQIKYQQKRSWKYSERHWASLSATSVGYSRCTCCTCTACLFPVPKHLPYQVICLLTEWKANTHFLHPICKNQMN